MDGCMDSRGIIRFGRGNKSQGCKVDTTAENSCFSYFYLVEKGICFQNLVVAMCSFETAGSCKIVDVWVNFLSMKMVSTS